jgi:translation initiation factor IF-2
VGDLAVMLEVAQPDLIKYLMSNGVMAGVNHTVDFDTAALCADHFGAEAESEADQAASGEAAGHKHPLLDLSLQDPATLVTRPPVVTVMGHVDHGKTSLLDAVRKTKVAAGEVGGITQKIGAYQVEHNGRRITFIDTPGHEAFSAMRARGADVTDVAVLVVAADDGVKPQTEEAIAHARTAGVPIVVAINKIDKEGANPDRVLQQLAERGLVSESYGGDIVTVKTSAKSGVGITDLLEMILLVSDISEPKANPNGSAVGTVLEAHLERGRGPLASVLVQNGTLRIGDNVVVGAVYGKVRALIDDTGKRLQSAGPATPVLLTGLQDVVDAGEIFQVTTTEREARTIADQRQLTARQVQQQPVRKISLEGMAADFAAGAVQTLSLVVKAESQGSMEALHGQIEKLQTPDRKIKFVAEGVGEVSESDVNLAAVAGAILIGFNVKPSVQAKAAADTQGVDVRTYEIVYKVTEDIEKALSGLLVAEAVEAFVGRAECRKVFQLDGKNTIAGCNVVDGKITRNSVIKVMRGKEEVFKGTVAQLKRNKDDAREVTKGLDCGITLEEFSDFQVGDVLEAFVTEPPAK